jgi:UDP-N-acetylmuramyl pentapeptide phosphotransferase/UDP-N-acetylglucosamine-1-phosphate transferase
VNPNELSGSGPPSPVAVIGIAAAVALILTGVIRRLAIAQAVLDVPNARSLHQQPTPRGGGLAIAVVLIGGLIYYRAMEGTIADVV